MINLPKYFEHVGNINSEPYRCYYVPFSPRDDFSLNREKSTLFFSLNGLWRIKKYDSIYDIPQNFFESEGEREIPVPSCVQLYGYDKPQYLNHNYPYPFDPPYVPKENPAYHYRKTFTLNDDGKDKFLVFEGVDSCFYLYVNKEFVGYSQISHKMTEYNVTSFLREGENVIDVIVLKWCASSYLEDQDKWRFTGIFRDVYLLSRAKKRVTDYVINADACGNLIYKTVNGACAEVSFNGETKVAENGKEVRFSVENPNLWSAETPFLYGLTIKTEEEIIYEEVGFREYKISDGVFYFNGKPIKIHGVNRHDFNCRTGATVSIDDIRKDLVLMKSLNVNAIRTSHYPPCPEFYRECDRFGFYVMSESDYESHGVVSCVTKLGYNVSAFGMISDMPFYEKAIVERQISNVKCNRNRPCVYMWSLGNESGWGRSLVAAAKKVREMDSRCIHYEGILYDKENYYTDLIDTASRMYPEYSAFDEFLNDEKEKRPLILCEYSHAMGNGPGDINDYWEKIESNNRFTGGFIWEWADHGIMYSGKEFLYGGDFSEQFHDGKFCIDGIVSADRKIKRGSLEMKHVYQPIKFVYNGNYLIVTNKNFFRPLEIRVEVLDEYNEKTFEVELAPWQSEKLRIGGKLYFNAHAYETGSDEMIANFTYVGKYIPETYYPMNNVFFTENGRFVTVRCGITEYSFDTFTAEISSIVKNRRKLCDYFKFNIARAPVDNDSSDFAEWCENRFYTAHSEVRSYRYENDTLYFTGHIVSEKVCPIVSYTVAYSFCNAGCKVSFNYTLNENFSSLPRIGFYSEFPDDFDLIEYLGYGEGESYVDMHSSCDFGFYTSNVNREYYHYVKPQESGSHYGTRKMQISNIDNSVKVEGNFSFSYLPYSIKQLSETKHDFELVKNGKNYLAVDFFMRGIGSHACGPELLDKYKVPRKGKCTLLISVV